MAGRIALHQTDREMFAEQRSRLAKSIPAKSVALLQGAKEEPKHDTDINHLFRQESYFFYLFGYNEPDCFGVVEGQTGKSVLFVPKIPESYAVWFGAIPTLAEIRDKVKIDEVHYTDDLLKVLESMGIEQVMVLNGLNSDSGLPTKTADFPGLADKFTVEKSSPTSKLLDILSAQRVIKTDKELALLERVCRISSEAHVHVMQMCRPGMSQNQLEAMFQHYCYFHGGCRFCSYTCICATGGCGAILHYPNNDKWIEDGQMALLDMGAEYDCYASDITCSFPVNGKFTERQLFVYNAVLDAQRAVLRSMKPGVSWVEMHKLALDTMLSHLIKEKLVVCDAATAHQHELMYYFQPHGLGHLLGMDAHDVGGYHKDAPERPKQQSCCRLRTARVLEKGMYLTVEPGLCFNHVLLEKCFADPVLKTLLNEEKIRKEFWDFGGVRIEDDVVVTENGIVNFTICPRGTHEIESVMSGTTFVGRKKEFVNV